MQTPEFTEMSLAARKGKLQFNKFSLYSVLASIKIPIAMTHSKK